MLHQTTGVYTHSEEQAAAAKEAFAAVKAGSSRPVATELLPAQVFWPAEAYHQQYLSAGGTRAARMDATAVL
jgi:peptide-methionine (S)-S-oxide reductase